MSENPWTTLSSKLEYDNPWISVTEHKVLNPKGGDGIYGVVHFKNLAIGVIPLDSEGYTWLVGQYRYPLEAYSWEIPEGGGSLNVPPVESAKRELLEETGLMANTCVPILTMHLSNSVSDEKAIIYLAQDLTQHEPCPEDTEELLIKKILIQDAINMVHNGEITDSMSVAGLLKVEWMLNKQKNGTWTKADEEKMSANIL